MNSVMADETPLQDLLRRIPCDAVLRWEIPEEGREPWQLGWSSSPVGMLSHRAADHLDALSAAPPVPALGGVFGWHWQEQGVWFFALAGEPHPDNATALYAHPAPGEARPSMYPDGDRP